MKSNHLQTICSIECCSVMCGVQLFETPGTVPHQAPLSIGLPRQGYWSRLPFPSPRDLPDPGIIPGSPALQTDSLLFEPPRKPICNIIGAQM